MTAPDHQLHPADRYFALQTLIGSWRPGIDDDSYRDRLAACLSKSLREADLRSHWTAPNTDYEQCLLHWVWDIVSGSDQVHQSCRQLIVRSAPTASEISVIQAVLRCTLPGIPDIYRGAEVIELSLVDPDNRRPVDTAALAQSLATSPIADPKLAAIRRCLPVAHRGSRRLDARRDDMAAARRSPARPLRVRAPGSARKDRRSGGIGRNAS